MARPKIVITEKMIQQVEALAAQGLSLEEIASVIGISIGTLARRKRDNDRLDQAIKRGQHKGIATITNSVFQKAKAGDNACMFFYLKNRAGWSDRVVHEGKLEHGGGVEHKHRVDFV